MSKIQEAIGLLRDCTCDDSKCIICNAYRTIVSDYQEREKGCDFCCNKNPRDNTPYHYSAQRCRYLDFSAYDKKETTEVNFCPMCGKRLKEDNT